MRLSTLVLTAAYAAVAAVAARGQATTGPAVLYAAPGARKLATVAQGTELRPSGRAAGYVRVTLRGFVARSLLSGPRDSFAVSVKTTDVRLRAAASTSAPVLASLEQGMGFHLLRRRGNWAEVERSGWVRRSAFPASLASDTDQPSPRRVRRNAGIAATSGTRRPPERPSPPARGDTSAPAPAAGIGMTPVQSGGLSPAPDLPPVATVLHGAVLTPLARQRGWVRVQLDGWMRESDLTAADSTMLGITAADLEASPQAYVGRIVRWTVTSLAFQTAGPLRSDMQLDEPYLLARGPGAETSLLYLALPTDLVDRAKALPAMAEIVVTAKVRTGRSTPSGVPILDVLTLAKK